jgi:hypothetical protein
MNDLVITAKIKQGPGYVLSNADVKIHAVAAEDLSELIASIIENKETVPK